MSHRMLRKEQVEGGDFVVFLLAENGKKVSMSQSKLNEKLAEAQENKYQNILNKLKPKNGDHILDVGCGIGGNAEFLAKKGYELETLSPDDFQRSVINEKFNGKIPFHHCKFEKFQPKKKVLFFFTY